MPREAAQLLNEALELPAEARAALADSLLDSLDTAEDTDVDQAWRVEIERRIVSLDERSAKLVPWEDVHARLNRRLQR
jgi:putative addiction module component (TIGR02574 family)